MCLFFVRFILHKCIQACWARFFYLFLLVPVTSAVANTWTLQPGIDVGEIYSDNISRSASQLAQDDFVTEVSPWLSIKNNARRLRLSLDYRLQNFIYAKDHRRNKTYDQLDANSTAIIVDNFLYFDAGGSAGQQYITPETNVPFDNVSATGNRTDYTTFTLSPYMHHSFGSSAIADVRYSYNRVDYAAANQASSQADQYSARVHNGPGFDRVTWSMSYSKQDVVYDRSPNATFESARAQLGYFIATSFNMNGTLGYEKNKYDTVAANTGGRIWNVGFNWAPSPRTSLSATYGRRFYGDSYSGSFKHASRLTQWTARYLEAVTSVRDMQLTSHTLGLLDSAGNVSFINVTFPELTSETFIRKRSELSVARKLRSGKISVQFYDDRRLYQATGDHEEQYGSRGSLSWSLSERSTFEVSGGWERYDYRSGGRIDDIWYSSVAATRQISKRLSSEMRYQHTERDSTENLSGYAENRISAYIHATF